MAVSTAMDKLVHFDISEIVFDIQLGRQSVTVFTLTNISDVDVVYKVKTTAPRRYCVRPNADILPPRTVIDIEIILQMFSAPPPDLHNCKDRFQLIVAPAPPATFSKGIPAVDLLRNTPPDRIQQAKFKVFFRLSGTSFPPSHSPQSPRVIEQEVNEGTEQNTSPDLDPVMPPSFDNGDPSIHARTKTSAAPALEERFMTAVPEPFDENDNDGRDHLRSITGRTTSIPATRAIDAQGRTADPKTHFVPSPFKAETVTSDHAQYWDRDATNEPELQSQYASPPTNRSQIPAPDPVSPEMSQSLWTSGRREAPQLESAPHANIESSLPPTNTQPVSSQLSPKSAAALARAPSIAERKLSLAEHIKLSESGPRADKPTLVDDMTMQTCIDNNTGEGSSSGETPSVATASRTYPPASAERTINQSLKSPNPSSTLNTTLPLPSRPSSVSAHPTNTANATKSPAARISDSAASSDQIAANRAKVIAGACAPSVTYAEPSESDAQRTAVERAAELYRLLMMMDKEIASVEAEIVEARHKLQDAKNAVEPAFAVKYEIDEASRIPLIQIVLMAAIAGIVLKLLV